MAFHDWSALLHRERPAPVTWDEIITGYDFGIMGPLEIQEWLGTQPAVGPCAARLLELKGEALLGFEEALWATCEEATGRTPRPGGRRWAAAQDRWRRALLKDALAAPLCAEALAVAVEAIYERVGCPEDMLGLWHRPSPWQHLPATADRAAIEAFLCGQDGAATS